MGREIRLVIPNWEHPKDEDGRYIPMYENSAQKEFLQWLEEYRNWVQQGLAKVIEEQPELEYDFASPYVSFCNYYGSPPNPENYFPNWEEGSNTWYQVYETVTEGTPVTPPFSSSDELVNYLISEGTFWDNRPWTLEAAENFVKQTKWLPSMAIYGSKIVDQTQQII